jgi:hypothetical protein
VLLIGLIVIPEGFFPGYAPTIMEPTKELLVPFIIDKVFDNVLAV